MMTRYSFLIKDDEDITVYTNKVKIYDWVEDDVFNMRECLNRLNETNERLKGTKLDLEVYKTNSNFDEFKLNNEIELLKKERDDAKKCLYNSNMRIDELVKEKEELWKRNDLLIKQYNALNHVNKNKINNLEEQIKKLKTKNKRASKLIAKLKLLVNDSDEYIKALKREIFDLKQYIKKDDEFQKRVFNTHLKRATKEKDEEIKRLKETIIQDNNFTLSMCKHGNEQNAKISELKQVIKQVNSENYRLKKKISSLNDCIKQMQYDMNHLYDIVLSDKDEEK